MARVLSPHWLDDKDKGEHRWLVFDWKPTFPGEFYHILERLKAAVPPEFRQWDEERKVWSVREDWVDALLPVFSNLRGSLDGMASQGSLAFEE